MQREVVDGIPFWTDKKTLYYYDVNPNSPKTIAIGTKSPDGTLKLNDNWEQHLAASLNQFHTDTVARSRKPAPALAPASASALAAR
jgi:hypothetical protein